MKRICLLMLMLALIAACKSSADTTDNAPEAETLVVSPHNNAFTVIDQGSSNYTQGSGISIRQLTLITIKTPDAFDAFWAKHKSGTAPTVDFTTAMVLVIMGPVYNTGGYAIGLDDIYADTAKLLVNASLKTPGPNCLTTQALTQPCIIVKTAATDLPILLGYSTTRVDCSD